MSIEPFTSAAHSVVFEWLTRLSELWPSDSTSRIVPVFLVLALAIVGLRIVWKVLRSLASGAWSLPFGICPDSVPSTTGRECQLGRPSIATSWNPRPGIPLHRALREARKLAGPDALCVLVVAGDGMRDLCHAIGLAPPGEGTVRIAAGNQTVLIDASGANARTLRRLASALPGRRPIDAAAAIANADGLPAGTLARTAKFSRESGFRVALHLVISSPRRIAAWQVVGSDNRDGRTLWCQLAQDAARQWLADGSRQGLPAISNAGARGLPDALDTALAAAAPRFVDIASLCFTGAGLRAAVADTTNRTRPARAPTIASGAGVATVLAGATLAGLVAHSGVNRSDALRATVQSVAEAFAAPPLTTHAEPVPSGHATRRIAELGAGLAGYSDLSPLQPLAFLVPNHGAPARLAAELLDFGVLHPLAKEANRRARDLLAPTHDALVWLENARQVSTWIAAWEGLASDPRTVGLRGLLSDVLGGTRDEWPRGLGSVLARAGDGSPEAIDKFDINALSVLTRQNFVTTMRRHAHSVYVDGPVAQAVRRVNQPGMGWRARHDALRGLRAALAARNQSWMMGAGHSSSYDFDLHVFEGAIALPQLGKAGVIEARRAVDRIRNRAREAAERSVVPDIGPVLVRTDNAAPGGGAGFTLSPRARSWLAFMDRIRSADVLDLPQPPAQPTDGPVTMNPETVAATRARLHTFDRYASNLRTDLSPAVAQPLLLGLAREMAPGVAAEVELAVRPIERFGNPAEVRPKVTAPKSIFDDLAAIEFWLREHHSEEAAQRVLGARARIADTLLESAALTLQVEDPIGIDLDASTDGTIAARRFEQGAERLWSIYQRNALPYVGMAGRGGEGSALQWLKIGQHLSRYRRGKADNALSELERMFHAYAEDPLSVCDQRRPWSAVTVDNYVERAVSRFRIKLARVCSERARSRMQAVYDSLEDYFNRHVSQLWPYSGNPDAPAISSAALGQFVRRLHAARDVLDRVEGPLVEPFRANARFWTPVADGGAALRFRITWRANREDEHLAHHLAAVGLTGVERDTNGIHTWRYDQPVTVRMMLAVNSPYRFVRASDSAGLVHTLDRHGSGALLRIFERLQDGASAFEAEVADNRGARQALRVTARVTYIDGVAISLRQPGDGQPESRAPKQRVAIGGA